MRPSNNLENKTPSDTSWRIQLVCVKVQAHNSLESPLEYNQDQMPLMNQGSLWSFQPFWELQKCYTVFSRQLCFIRCRRQQLWAVEYRRHSRFTFVENTISNLPKVMRAKFLGSDRLFCFINICKSGSFENLFAMITSLSELYFKFRGLCLYKWNEWFLWTMAEVQAAENHGDEQGLTWYLQAGIYKSIPTWTLLQNSLADA